MEKRTIRYIAVILLIVMLVGLCACNNMFANFNDGMPKGTNRGEYPPEYSYDKNELAREAEERRETIANVAMWAVVLLGGIIGLAAPKVIWWLTTGWRIKDAEPSDFALIVYRIIGGLVIIAGIIMLMDVLAS